MSSGGGGSSGSTQYNWNPVIGSYWGGAPGADGRGGGGVLGWAMDEAGKGYQQYGGKRIADRNQDQFTAAQRVRDMAASGGTPESAVARQTAGDFAAGRNLRANQYMGDNPFFRSSLQSNLEDVTNAYKQGTSADTTRMFNLAGAFGGSAHQNAVANNEAGLARNLSRMSNEAYQQQYDRSANLMESALGRQMQAIPLAYQGQSLQNDLNDRLMGIGGWEQGEQQKYLDQGYNDWANANNWGRQNVGWLVDILSRAQGGTGITQTNAGYQPANYGSMAVGAGLLGRSAGLF